MPKVTFVNEAVTLEAERGKTLKELAEGAGINLYEGFWSIYHCSGSGKCIGNGCRVWVAEGKSGAASPRTFWEKIRPSHSGQIRLACQVHVEGDLDVRTQPGAVGDNVPNMKWEPDPAPSKWKDRLEGKGAPGPEDDAAADEPAE